MILCVYARKSNTVNFCVMPENEKSFYVISRNFISSYSEKINLLKILANQIVSPCQVSQWTNQITGNMICINHLFNEK